MFPPLTGKEKKSILAAGRLVPSENFKVMVTSPLSCRKPN